MSEQVQNVTELPVAKKSFPWKKTAVGVAGAVTISALAAVTVAFLKGKDDEVTEEPTDEQNVAEA